MSGITLSEVDALTAGVVTLDASSTFSATGFAIQSKYIRTDAKNTYAAPITGNGTTVTDLNISITPKFASSLILLQWMINGEVFYNSTFLIHKDGALITTAGYEAYNAAAGNVRWSGFMGATYDRDDLSTPSNYFIQYAVPAENTTARTYAPAIRSSDGTARTLYLNRSITSAGADNYETSISTGFAMEIGQ